MLVKRISVAEARANFSTLLGSVHYSKEAVIVERKGKPFAVVISPEQYQSLKAQQEAAFRRLEEVAERNADKDPDQILSEVTKEVEAVRKTRYAQRKRAKKISGVDGLLGLVELGKKLKIKAPKDLSTRVDDYLYGDKK